MTSAADKAWMKEVLSDFLLDFLGETGAMGYFPDMSEEEWLESIPDECVERFMENFAVVGDEGE